MILDFNYLFDGTTGASGLTGVAVTAAAATQASTNVIDLLNARDMGIGDNPSLKLMVLITAAFTSTGSATLQVKAQASDTNTSGATWTTYAETAALQVSGYAAGAKIAQFDWPGINPDTGGLPRYLRLGYTVATALFSAGSVISGIVLGRDDARAYPPGYTVVN